MLADGALARRLPQIGEEHMVFPVLFYFCFLLTKRAFCNISAAARPTGSFLACLKLHSGEEKKQERVCVGGGSDRASRSAYLTIFIISHCVSLHVFLFYYVIKYFEAVHAQKHKRGVYTWPSPGRASGYEHQGKRRRRLLWTTVSEAEAIDGRC